MQMYACFGSGFPRKIHALFGLVSYNDPCYSPCFQSPQVMDIDTVGTFNMCRASFEDLRKSKYGGVVTLVPNLSGCF